MRTFILLLLGLLSGCAKYGIMEAKQHHNPYTGDERERVVPVYGFNHYRDTSSHNGMLKILEVEGHPIPRLPLIGGHGAYGVSLPPGVWQIKVLYVYSYVNVDYYSYHTYNLNMRSGHGYFLTVQFRGPGDEVRFGVEEVPMAENEAKALRI